MTNDDIPAEIAELDALYESQLRLHDELEARIEAFESDLRRAVRGYASSQIRLNTPSARQVIEANFERVETIACRLLSAPLAPFVCQHGWRPEIDHHRVEAWDEASNARAQKGRPAYKPSVYWKILAAKADPVTQKAAASRGAARALARGIGLITAWRDGRNPAFQPPKVVRGFVLIDDFRVSERSGFSSRDTYVCESAHEFAGALDYALKETGSDMVSVGSVLVSLLRELSMRSGFQSREKFELPHGASLVTFKQASKLYLPKPVADTMNLFISEHLADVLSLEAAA